MKPEIENWIKALESNKYHQGYSALCVPMVDGNKYCCLGVLCECLAIKRTDFGNGLRSSYVINGVEEEATIPQSLAYALGLTEQIIHYLIQMNDTEDRTFPEIAAFLREKYSDPKELKD